MKIFILEISNTVIWENELSQFYPILLLRYLQNLYKKMQMHFLINHDNYL